MKARAILAVLLCQLLCTTQSYAIAGGPPTGSGGFSSLNVVGTYSGVLMGVLDKDATTGITATSDSLALFTMNVPVTGLATGTSLVFASGRIFTGTISAAVDPDKGSVRGLINATYNFSYPVITTSVTDVNGVPFITTATTTVTVTASALGKLTAAIKASTTSSTGTTTASQTLVLDRITGTAQLNTDFGQINPNTFAPVIARITTYTVDGFKQQAVTSAAGSSTTSTTGSSPLTGS